jgi:metal-sulfur cluster biosynthetic enzyme
MSSVTGTNRPEWVSEKTNPDLTEKLKTALSEIIDPEIGYNILQLGLIRDVLINNESATIHMILTTPFCPYGPEMLERTRTIAEETLERPTELELGMEMWDFSMMEEGLGNDWGLF